MQTVPDSASPRHVTLPPTTPRRWSVERKSCPQKRRFLEFPRLSSALTSLSAFTSILKFSCFLSLTMICSCFHSFFFFFFFFFFSLVSVLPSTGRHLWSVVVSVSVRRKYTTGLLGAVVGAEWVLKRFNVDVVYSEAGEDCGGVVGRMSVLLLLYKRVPIRCRELPCWNKGDNWLGWRSDLNKRSCFPLGFGPLHPATNGLPSCGLSHSWLHPRLEHWQGLTWAYR